MKNVFLIIVLLFSLGTLAQYDYRDSNRIGIGVGINQFSLNTDNFNATPGTGWNAGLSVRGNFYNDFDMVYGIQFSENNFLAETRDGIAIEEVKFKLPSAQISLLLSYKIVESHLSVEFGPMFQVNGKLTYEDGFENNTIENTAMTVKDLSDISKFSLYPTIGITAGITNLRANITYQYGVTNLLGNLNGNGFGDDFKGNAGILSGNILIYL